MRSLLGKSYRSRYRWLVNAEVLGINPTFENNTNVVSIPCGEAAVANRDKIVERDVEICRQKSQPPEYSRALVLLTL